jgi:hypothetical protein
LSVDDAPAKDGGPSSTGPAAGARRP